MLLVCSWLDLIQSARGVCVPCAASASAWERRRWNRPYFTRQCLSRGFYRENENACAWIDVSKQCARERVLNYYCGARGLQGAREEKGLQRSCICSVICLSKLFLLFLHCILLSLRLARSTVSKEIKLNKIDLQICAVGAQAPSSFLFGSANHVPHCETLAVSDNGLCSRSFARSVAFIFQRPPRL